MARDTYNAGIIDGPIEGSWFAYQEAVSSLVARTGPESFYPVLWL